MLILAVGGPGQKFFSSPVELMKAVGPIDHQATAYVCENYVCQLPTTDVKKLAQLLAGEKPLRANKLSTVHRHP